MSLRIPRSLFIPYNTWKEVIQDNNFPLFHSIRDSQTNFAQLFAGTRQWIYFSEVTNTNDYDDWSTNFSNNSHLVDSEDDAIAHMIGLDSYGAVNEGDKYNPTDVRWEEWSNTPIDLSNTYIDVFTKTGYLYLFETVFQANTDNIVIKIEVDGISKMDLDLGDLQDSNKLSIDINSTDFNFSLIKYKNKRWLIKPPVPILAKSSLKIKAKVSSGNNKRIERGLSVWGEL